MRRLRSALAGVLLAFAGCSATPHGAVDPGGCRPRRLAEIPLQKSRGLMLVEGRIDAAPVRLVLDTGAGRTLLFAAAVTRLGLPRDPAHGTRIWGVGGRSASFDVLAKQVTLGDVAIPLRHVAVGDFAISPVLGPIDGLLGADVLHRFDLDLDEPRGKLVLYQASSCRLPAPPWSGRALELPGVEAQGSRLMLPIVLDGVGSLATLDTGAQATAVSWSLARKTGVAKDGATADPALWAHGAAPSDAPARLHHFQSLRVGPLLARHPALAVLELPEVAGGGLVGGDLFRGRRVWLSFAAQQVFVDEGGK